MATKRRTKPSGALLPAAASLAPSSEARLDYLPLSQLRPAARNPKRHDLEAIQASLDRFGYVAPIVVNATTGAIVAGHGRLDALRHAKARGEAPPQRIRVEAGGDWAVPVVRVAFDTDQAAEAYVLADNRLGELGGYDDTVLGQLLSELAEADALAGTGYDAEDLDALHQKLTEAESSEAAALAEVSEDNPTLTAFIAARRLARQRGKDKGEINFCVCLVFQSYAQKQEFLNGLSEIPSRYGMYVDGEVFAQRCGIPLTPEMNPPLASVVEKKLAALVLP